MANREDHHAPRRTMDIRFTCLTLLVAPGCVRQHRALQLAPTDVSVILTIEADHQ